MALSSILKGLSRSPLTNSLLRIVPESTPFAFARNSLVHAISKVNFSTTNALENIRCHFPRPSEVKRIRRHGWKHRMSTPAGRKIIMNRILKGRWTLSH